MEADEVDELLEVVLELHRAVEQLCVAVLEDRPDERRRQAEKALSALRSSESKARRLR